MFTPIQIFNIKTRHCISSPLITGPVILFDNLSGNVYGLIQWGIEQIIVAQQFKTDNNTYTLNSIIIDLNAFITNDMITMTICSDIGNLPNESVSIGTLTTSATSIPVYPIINPSTFTPTSNIILSPNSSYWIVLSGGLYPSDSYWEWRNTLAGGGIGYSSLTAYKGIGIEDVWSINPINVPPGRCQINATI